jgi:PTH1 family peptidyl-tRNA hydrolase
MEQWHIIAGLGNPGAQYARTRHNIGFMAVEEVAKRWRAGWAKEKKLSVRMVRVDQAGRKVLVCQPDTFMNASGEAVAKVTTFYRVERQNLLVVVDDADLDFGALRLRPEGSSGGHHGLESIQQHLGSTQFPRLRIGIGRNDPASREITGHVLSQFRKDEGELLEKVLTRACDQIECWLTEGILSAMNRFNGIIKS